MLIMLKEVETMNEEETEEWLGRLAFDEYNIVADGYHL